MNFIKINDIIEVKVPNINKPIKAIVLDIIGIPCKESQFDNIEYCYFILYAQNRIFSVTVTHVSYYDENNVEINKYLNFEYNKIICEYCIISSADICLAANNKD